MLSHLGESTRNVVQSDAVEREQRALCFDAAADALFRQPVDHAAAAAPIQGPNLPIAIQEVLHEAAARHQEDVAARAASVKEQHGRRAAAFAAMARADSGCEVWQQDFLALDLPPERFDGVFANAALFHVPSQELPRVLRELHATLKPRGVLFSSNPHGNDQEGWNRGRYGAYHRLETWRHHVEDAGFVELAHYYRPEGVPREQQPWLATVWRKAPVPAGDTTPTAS